MDYMIVSILRELCIKNNWFTEGTESRNRVTVQQDVFPC